jgi:hypothetical protein
MTAPRPPPERRCRDPSTRPDGILSHGRVLWGQTFAAFGGGAWLLAALSGCGHSEDEWHAAQDQIAHLSADFAAANRTRAQDDPRYGAAQRALDEIQAKLDSISQSQAQCEAAEQDLREHLFACQVQDCPARCTAAADTVTTGPIVPASVVDPSPLIRTIPYEGNGGGPTLCADGSVSGSAGRGTCSHHGGVSGGRRRRH